MSQTLVANFPMDYYMPVKVSSPRSHDWPLDNAIDLFSMNTIMPEDLNLNVAGDMMDLLPMNASSTFGASTMPNITDDSLSHGSVSSDPESDDQAWSPTYVPDLPTLQAAVEAPSTSVSTTGAARPSTVKAESDPTNSRHITPTLPEQPPQSQSASRTTHPPPQRKKSRNSSTSSDASSSSAHTAPPVGRTAAKRAAHNVIEKRYRTNMNAKFMALEKAVLQSTAAAQGGKSVPADGDSVALKKSEILSNAIACIHDLHDENVALRKQLDLLRQNLLPGGGLWRCGKRGSNPY